MSKKRTIACLMSLMLILFTGSVYAGNEGDAQQNSYYGTNAGASLDGTGWYNAFFGYNAGNNTTGGDANTFLGYYAGNYNTTGSYNTFLGMFAGSNNTTGYSNTFLGYRAGYSNTEGDLNTFIGEAAGTSNTTGYSNTFLGRYAGYSNTTGSHNTFLGHYAGRFNTTGGLNTFLGYDAGFNNTTGGSNTFLGRSAGANNTTGDSNTFLGMLAGGNTTTGDSNVFLGYAAGRVSETGSRNVFLGNYAGYYETGSDKLYIDNSDTSSPLIYGEFDNDIVTVNGNLEVIGPDNGLVWLSDNTTDSTLKASRMVLWHYTNSEEPVYLFGAASTGTNNFVAFGGGSTIGNAATQLDLFTAPNTTTPAGTPRLTIIGNGNVGIGTQSPFYPLEMASGAYVTAGGVWTDYSSRESKENIQKLSSNEAIDTLKGLSPVKFNYKVDAEERHVGFIAEDVPELIASKDRKGLSPMDIVAVLTRVVQEQQKTIADLKEQNKTIYEKMNEFERELKLKGSIAMADTE